MEKDLSHYPNFARLLDYPSVLPAPSLDHEEIKYFLDGIPDQLTDLQELYSRSFEVQAITTLYVGYVLFGDDYKRATLLSHLKREHLLAKNDLNEELPDYLPNILRLLPKLTDPELLQELVCEILFPAVTLMIREFDPDRIEKKNANYQKHYKTLLENAPESNPRIYCHVLKALLIALKQDFQITEKPFQSNGFMELIEKEMRTSL